MRHTECRTAADRAVLSELSSKATECVGETPQAAILDIPHHTNSGDAAILLGELAAMAAAGTTVAYLSHFFTFRPTELRRTVPEQSTVYCHGGGNFGDLYPDVHQFRLEVLRALPDRKIVQLPVTIRFDRDVIDEGTKRAVAMHPNVTLYCRDGHSYALASEQLEAECRLAPDMAFSLGILPCPYEPRIPVLWLARGDIEAGHHAPIAAPDVEIADWPATEPSAKRLELVPSMVVYSGLSLLGRAPGRLDRAATALVSLLVPLGRLHLLRGIRALSRGEVVVTDRLHGHILSVLLGIPHVVIENGYGKLSDFVDTWTGRLSYVHVAPDSASALECARDLVRHGRR